ncbi:MAG: dolichyl-phosphate beta-glucosyltransferase [Candidatus Woesearchaeota archaeon]
MRQEKLSKQIIGVSVVIPAYNEQSRICDSLKKIQEFLSRQKMDFEIIVVDDGSKDCTASLVRSTKGVILLENHKNMGKGYSVKRGVLHAKMGYVLFSDADLSTPISELAKLLEHIGYYDIVIGSRRMSGSKILIMQPWYRRIPGKVFPFIVSILLLGGISDTQCGFKLFKKEAAQVLFSMQRLERFSFDAEILFLAKKKGYHIKELPVVWVNALDSKLNAVTDSFDMFWELLKIKWNYLVGKYDRGKSLIASGKS